MKSLRDLKPRRYKAIKCNYGINNEIVKPDLALTPADIKRLTDKGIAVSTQTMAQINDADSVSYASSYDPVYSRGMDINKSWEISQQQRNGLLSDYKTKKK